MPRGTLFVVATPIGNLEDITLRALRILKSVAVVAAEDTRRTGNLLRHYGIQTPLLSVHQHNERVRAPKILARLHAGDSVALVTDAGTPGISDPGAQLVEVVRAAGYKVEPIPGPAAVIAALSASGIDTDGFTFLGFPPIMSKDRKIWLESLVLVSKIRASVVYEAPHKLLKTLIDLDILVKRPIFVAREVTKLHEEFKWGMPGELVKDFSSPQGEFTLIIPPEGEAEKRESSWTDAQIADHFGQLTEKTRFRSKKDAVRVLAERLGLTPKQVYGALERLK
jgi:16S rRNA (cytidine1402-2'-O)-methyltransferase